MGKVITVASVSLDGFIAEPDDSVGPLFDWYGNGDVEVTMGDEERVFRTSAASAEYLRTAYANVSRRSDRPPALRSDEWLGGSTAGRRCRVRRNALPADRLAVPGCAVHLRH